MKTIKKFSDPVIRRKESGTEKPVVQTKLKVSHPGDKSEQEADRVADTVMRMPEEEEQPDVNMKPEEEEESAVNMQPEQEEEKVSMQAEEEEEPSGVQMKEEEEEGNIQMQEEDDDSTVAMQTENSEEEINKAPDDEDNEIQTKPVQSSGTKAKFAPKNINNQVAKNQAGGNPLPQKINRELSGKMGKDFSDVRIHTDTNAVQMNKELHAKAFTHKNHVYFNQGQFAPGNSAGKRLLAHELTHVVQQNPKSGPMIQAKWINDKYRYDTEPEAIRRKKALRKKYGKADCFPVKTQWQCRYWVNDDQPVKSPKAPKPVPKANPKPSPPKVLKLEKIKAGIKPFTALELNDALLTVFGEISAKITATIHDEARAIASTIFNRYYRILATRTEYAAKLKIKKKASQRYQTAIQDLEELTKHPSKYKKELGKKEYQKAVEKATKEYQQATKAQSTATKDLQKANDEKIAAESYMQEKYRKLSKITLTMIVDDINQYEGYPKGKKDYGHFSKMNSPDQKRNEKRWKIAKKAVKDIAGKTVIPDKYVQFRSNKGGKRKLKKGEKRIGGNDFW
jgi:hypothetical protein